MFERLRNNLLSPCVAIVVAVASEAFDQLCEGVELRRGQ